MANLMHGLWIRCDTHLSASSTDSLQSSPAGLQSYGDAAELIADGRRYGDYNGRDRVGYIAWNVGLLDEGLEAANQTCAMDTVPTCFDSCAHKVPAPTWYVATCDN